MGVSGNMMYLNHAFLAKTHPRHEFTKSADVYSLFRACDFNFIKGDAWNTFSYDLWSFSFQIQLFFSKASLGAKFSLHRPSSFATSQDQEASVTWRRLETPCHPVTVKVRIYVLVYILYIVTYIYIYLVNLIYGILALQVFVKNICFFHLTWPMWGFQKGNWKWAIKPFYSLQNRGNFWLILALQRSQALWAKTAWQKAKNELKEAQKRAGDVQECE